MRQKFEQCLQNLDTDCIDLLQLHTWTRAWNKNPKALQVLRELQGGGKIRSIGISTPEDDQNCVIDLMRQGHVDVVQVVYNIFEQEPAAELLPTAGEYNIGIIVRVPFDEGALTGKFTKDTKFSEDDFRINYFAGDRLARTVERIEKIKTQIIGTGLSLAQVALKFILAHSTVSTVIPGARNTAQAKANATASDLPELSADLLEKLKKHAWRRGFWYAGK